MHEEINARSENDSRDDNVPHDEWQISAGHVQDAGCAKGNDKVKNGAEDHRGHSALVGFCTEDTGGNRLWNQLRMPGAVNDDGVREVQNAGDQAA